MLYDNNLGDSGAADLASVARAGIFPVLRQLDISGKLKFPGIVEEIYFLH